MARALTDRGVRFPPEHMPLCFRDMSGRYGADFKRFTPDFFMSRSVVLTVSQKMHDVLVQFDMGDNQLTELPFVAHDRVTPRPERFWLLAIAEKNRVWMSRRLQSGHVRRSRTEKSSDYPTP